MDKMCSKVIVVYVPRDIQLERLHKRNPELGDEAEMRINSQMSTEEKKKRTNLVIDNSGSLEETRKQVETIYKNEFPHSSLFTIRNYVLVASLVSTALITWFWIGK